MSENPLGQIRLNKIPEVAKLFLTAFILVMGIGYLCAVLNVGSTCGTSYSAIADHYAGSLEDPIGYPPMDLPTLASTSHTHFLGMGFLFFSLGMIFLFTNTLPAWLKKTVLIDSFIAIFIAVSSFWLIRYVARETAFLMILSGMLLGISCAFEVFVPLYEMWIKKDS